MRLITNKELCDQDFWTQAVHKYSNIPAGTEVELVKVFSNLYGTYARVSYNGQVYDVNPYDLHPKK